MTRPILAADDPYLSEAFVVTIRLVEGGALADLGLTNLYPGGVYWDSAASRNRPLVLAVRERVEALTGAEPAVVDDVLRRLWGWRERSEPESEGGSP